MTAVRCIGICTGGDAPGLNAVIRAVIKCAFLKYKGRSSASPDGFVDLAREILELTLKDVSGISASGGTILGTPNRGDPYRYCTVEERHGSCSRYFGCRDRERPQVGN